MPVVLAVARANAPMMAAQALLLSSSVSTPVSTTTTASTATLPNGWAHEIKAFAIHSAAPLLSRALLTPNAAAIKIRTGRSILRFASREEVQPVNTVSAAPISEMRAE